MIRVENLSRRYGKFTAVDTVNFNIQSGEIVGLLGHNGAGKTTIMKMLTGFLEPSGGSINIGDFNISEQATEAQQLIGYLPENLPIYPEMTVIDYLLYCARLRNIVDSEIDTRVMNAIDKTMLQEKALQPISTLSRGFKQRVGVAQSLIHSPKLLILDEPTNGLDPYQTNQMRTLIKSLSKEATVILSTHIMQEVDALCDRVLILDSGKLAVDQTMEELRRSDTLELKTSATENTINKVLGELNIQNKKIDATDNSYTYHLPIPAHSVVDDLSAEIIERLLKSGEKVFALHPLLRDLEVVFRKVHAEKTQEEIRNVA